MKAIYKKYILNFKQASGTSRGVLRTKETYFLYLIDNEKRGIGECAVFRGLSADDRPDYERKLQWVCENIQLGKEKLLEELYEFPSIQFGIEQAFLSFDNNNMFSLFPSNFTTGKEAININGLIWMGDKNFMNKQIEEKIKAGFTTIKMKIGAIDFNTEIDLLQSIRSNFSVYDIELRVDANGAFSPEEALKKLDRLSKLEIHSIEQPIKQEQWIEMAKLCKETPLPIALDEDLIGVFFKEEKEIILKEIQPQYIILKPSLVGGIQGSNEWIEYAEKYNIGWWITSALESNIGLNAIAQYTYSLQNKMPQGLGTGGLFTNNIASPLEVKNGSLHYNTTKNWHLEDLFFN
ncbi:o-succinylbenzoate synthase [Aureivirga marina]|uniref:o-succinylbenzoate synthase n=1 Tax=Aureivirga marina TaxID=1182451 RepID=UPI0018CBD8C3|nr:o-succinylbenzoate synthase [Aureivirga marina]